MEFCPLPSCFMMCCTSLTWLATCCPFSTSPGRRATLSSSLRPLCCSTTRDSCASRPMSTSTMWATSRATLSPSRRLRSLHPPPVIRTSPCGTSAVATSISMICALWCERSLSVASPFAPSAPPLVSASPALLASSTATPSLVLPPGNSFNWPWSTPTSRASSPPQRLRGTSTGWYSSTMPHASGPWLTSSARAMLSRHSRRTRLMLRTAWAFASRPHATTRVGSTWDSSTSTFVPSMASTGSTLSQMSPTRMEWLNERIGRHLRVPLPSWLRPSSLLHFGATLFRPFCTLAIACPPLPSMVTFPTLSGRAMGASLMSPTFESLVAWPMCLFARRSARHCSPTRASASSLAIQMAPRPGDFGTLQRRR